MQRRPPRPLESVEPLAQRHQRGIVKSGAHAAGIAPVTGGVVIADMQGADTQASSGRGRPAEHDELRPTEAFHLHPAMPAAGAIRRIPSLHHDPLKPRGRRRGQERLACAQPMIVGAQHAVPTGNPAQQCLAVQQRTGAQIPLAEMHEVERLINQLMVAPVRQRRLKPREAQHALRPQHHHFAVQPCPIDAQFGERPRQSRHPVAPIMPVAGEQTHIAAVDAHQQPIPIQLDFADPILAPRRRGGRGTQLRGLPAWQGGLARPAGGGTGVTRKRCGRRRPAGLQGGGIAALARAGIIVLDQQPGILPAALLHADERERAGQTFAVQREMQMSLAHPEHGIRQGRPVATVPDLHRSRAILALRNLPTERCVLDRMIFDMDRHTPIGGIQRRPLRHRPAPQHTVMLKANIPVQAGTRGKMLLHDEDRARFSLRSDARPRLWRAREITLARIAAQRRLGNARGPVPTARSRHLRSLRPARVIEIGPQHVGIAYLRVRPRNRIGRTADACLPAAGPVTGCRHPAPDQERNHNNKRRKRQQKKWMHFHVLQMMLMNNSRSGCKFPDPDGA
jgi:hypothetical protein